MTYASWWVRVWSIAATMGFGLAILEWSAPGAAAVLLGASGVMSLAVITVAQLRATPLEPGWGWRRVLVWSSAGGVGLVGLVALLTASPPLALVALLLVLATCPIVARRLRRPTGRLTTGSAERPPPRASVGVGDLSDHELCMMWRRTFWDLRTHRTTDGLISTVFLRQACLDELERRNPAAVRAWLESGTSASGGPERFWGDSTRADGAA